MPKPTLTEQLEAANERIAALETERDTSAADVAALTAERDELSARASDLDATVTALTADVAGLTAERDQLAEQVGAITAERDAATEQVAALERVTKVLPGHKNLGGESAAPVPGADGSEESGKDLMAELSAVRGTPKFLEFWNKNKAEILAAARQ